MCTPAMLSQYARSVVLLLLQVSMAARYSVLLPRTSFPLRRTVAEATLQKSAGFDQLYRWQQAEYADRKCFTLHDGPPYANGEPHVGHALNKILKDIINRFKLLKGHRINYRPGWDCHGLPIELKACRESELKHSSPLDIRSKAASFASRTLEVQKAAFQSWGCMGDWDHPYLTMEPQYEANQLAVFYKMYKRGCIYRGFKPVYWSPSSRSALAEAELEYKEHTSRAVYVLFPLTRCPGVEPGAHALVWTTTPWTLVANQALCFHPKLSYSVIEMLAADGAERTVVVGSACLPRLQSVLGLENVRVKSQIPGSVLAEFRYQHPLDSGRCSMPFLPAAHVTETEGTGLVHTAPAHGFEDHLVAVDNGLDLQCSVDERGCYTSQAGSDLEGKFALKKGNEEAISKLSGRGLLLHEHAHSHRYPYDWRTKKPVLIRSTEQWFASVSLLKEEAKKALREVVFFPENSANRLAVMLDTRSDWCISRQRVWGVPIPVFYHRETNQPLINDDTIAHIESVFREHGSDSWWQLSTKQLLPPSLQPQADDYVPGADTMDVWFDSGSSWSSVLREEGGVADMYLEGSDQFRGWFQSSLLTSVAAQGRAPYRSVVTHDFVVDGKGMKMSKSIGNVISPAEVISEYGVDVMRLWVGTSSFTSMVHISDSGLQQTRDFLLKIRNTCRFLLGNLADFNPDRDLLDYPQLTALDRYMLHVLSCYSSEVTDAYESLNFSRLNNILTKFVPKDLSAFYFDIVKDRLYCEPSSSVSRRSVQSVLHHLLQVLVRSLAPITPHLAEEVALHYSFKNGTACSTMHTDVAYSTVSITQAACSRASGGRVRGCGYNQSWQRGFLPSAHSKN